MKKFFGGRGMKMKNKILEVEELRELKGQAKVKKHEEFCGREYDENNEG